MKKVISCFLATILLFNFVQAQRVISPKNADIIERLKVKVYTINEQLKTETNPNRITELKARRAAAEAQLKEAARYIRAPSRKTMRNAMNQEGIELPNGFRFQKFSRQLESPVQLRGMGLLGVGQMTIDAIANWDQMSLAAKREYCRIKFGGAVFANQYGHPPTWQRFFNFGYVTDQMMKDYLREQLNELLAKEKELTADEKELRQAYINCLTNLQNQ